MPSIALQPNWDIIRELYNSGLTLRDISTQTGVKPGTIAARASRASWKAVATQARLIAQKGQTEGKGDSDPLTKHSKAVRNGLGELLARSVDKIQAVTLKSPKHALAVSQELESVVRNCKTVFGWSEGQHTPAVRINILGSATIATDQPTLPSSTTTPLPPSEQP